MKILVIRLKSIIFSGVLGSALITSAQIPTVVFEGEAYVNRQQNACVSEERHESIVAELQNNVAMLGLQKTSKGHRQEKNQAVIFTWPLRASASLDYNNYYAISNFVDQNRAQGVRDYACGARTYDQHNGVDIVTWPFEWMLFDNNAVEVIAAAPGIIIGKTDGFYDRNCGCVSNDWNAVYIQHTDGSKAWYGHLKKNTVTIKAIGQSVARGEYLGIVGSSGCSTAPHLHFEVYDNTNSLIDPYNGSCNGTNSTSWWAQQKPYREPTLNTLLTHHSIPQLGCPGTAESPNISNAFAPGETAILAAYFQDILKDDQHINRIRRPDGSVAYSLTLTSSQDYTQAYWYINYILPTSGPFGTWTYEVDYRGNTFQRQFELNAPMPVELTSFTGNLTSQGAVLLAWSTASETNSAYFEIQRSSNGHIWLSIDSVDAAGTTRAATDYIAYDQTPPDNNNYYRLRQVDHDGSTSYSQTVQVLIPLTESIQIFPNPASSFLTVEGSVRPAVQIFDLAGKRVLGPVRSTTVDISGLPSGMYFASIRTDSQEVAKRFVKK